MRKYLTVFSKAIISQINFRTQLVIWIIIEVTRSSCTLLIWYFIFSDSPPIKGYDFPAMVRYIFLVVVIHNITGVFFEEKRCQKIKDGKLDFFLVKPLKFPTELFFTHMGRHLVYNLLCIPSWLLLIILFQKHLTPIFLSPPIVWLQFITLLIFSRSIEYLLSFIVVTMTFFVEEANGLVHFKWMMLHLFSGAMVPFVFMPKWLMKISEALPFKYMYYLPINIILGNYTLKYQDIIYMGLVVVVLLLSSSFLWKKGVKRYVSVGG